MALTGGSGMRRCSNDEPALANPIRLPMAYDCGWGYPARARGRRNSIHRRCRVGESSELAISDQQTASWFKARVQMWRVRRSLGERKNREKGVEAAVLSSSMQLWFSAALFASLALPSPCSALANNEAEGRGDMRT